MTEPDIIRLRDVGRGVLEERFRVALTNVATNIKDPNTSPAACREINIKVKIKPHKADPNFCSFSTQVTEKLAPVEEWQSTLMIGIDSHGTVHAQEMLPAENQTMFEVLDQAEEDLK